MQTGFEKGLTMLLPALAGANLIYGLGMVEMGMTLSFGQLVADNEFARMIRRILEGIPVADESLAVDVIRQVGAGGHFLTQEHTLRHMRTCQSRNRLIDRNMRYAWESGGKRDLTARCDEEARSVLENHKPEPLSQAVAAGLRQIIEETETELGVHK